MKSKWIIGVLVGCLLCGCSNQKPEIVDATDIIQIQDNDTQESSQANVIEQKTPQESLSIEANKDVEDAVILYEKFLGIQESDDVISALIDEKYQSDNEGLHYTFEVGDALTFQNLKEYVKSEYLETRGMEDEEPTISYTYIDCGLDGKNELAIKFQGLGINGIDDDSYAVFIISEREKELFITYSYACWARSEVSMNQAGYLTGGGSAGAGDYIYDACVLNADGVCQTIYEAEELSGWWINYINEEAYQNIFGDVEEPDMYVVKYHVGEEEVYTYGLLNEDNEEHTENQMFVDACSEEGILWKSQEEIDEMIQNRENELQVTTEMKNDEYLQWITME